MMRSELPRHQPRKGLAVASLVLGILSLSTLGLLGVGAVAGLTLGIVALLKANNSPAQYGGKGIAIAGIATSALSFLMIPLLGIVAAIAIPSLLRARISAIEAAAIGDIRTMVSAEAGYAASNGGLYDTPECLAAPAGCIPGYQGPEFLNSELASLSSKGGYLRSFHPGPPPEASLAPPAPRPRA